MEPPKYSQVMCGGIASILVKHVGRGVARGTAWGIGADDAIASVGSQSLAQWHAATTTGILTGILAGFAALHLDPASPSIFEHLGAMVLGGGTTETAAHATRRRHTDLYTEFPELFMSEAQCLLCVCVTCSLLFTAMWCFAPLTWCVWTMRASAGAIIGCALVVGSWNGVTWSKEPANLPFCTDFVRTSISRVFAPIIGVIRAAIVVTILAAIVFAATLTAIVFAVMFAADNWLAVSLAARLVARLAASFAAILLLSLLLFLLLREFIRESIRLQLHLAPAKGVKECRYAQAVASIQIDAALEVFPPEAERMWRMARMRTTRPSSTSLEAAAARQRVK
ncbi:hypothetical protein FOA52_012369 [Chlamydomonas sp. UWO 241]|nr:hypothetical protein FOA52_012369 [Chlamydomonas sp. UWO 241]